MFECKREITKYAFIQIMSKIFICFKRKYQMHFES